MTLKTAIANLFALRHPDQVEAEALRTEVRRLRAGLSAVALCRDGTAARLARAVLAGRDPYHWTGTTHHPEDLDP